MNIYSSAPCGVRSVGSRDTGQNKTRAVDLKSIRKPASCDGQASGLRNFRIQVTAYCDTADADMRREMEEASRSEVPILTGSMTQGEADRSRQLYYMLVLSCVVGAMGVMENVPGGEGCEAWKRLHHPYHPGLPRRCAGMRAHSRTKTCLRTSKSQSCTRTCRMPSSGSTR